MAVRNKEEIMASLNSIFAENDSDEVLSVLEDVSDTIDSFASSENWEQKYKENDAEWRKRYKDRFENKEGEKIEEHEEHEENEILTYEDLFK